MNRRFLFVATLSLAIPLAATAQSSQTASVTAPMSPHDIQNLIKSAHSRAEYTELASYYRQQEANYRARAAADKDERDRRAKVNAALYQKYPRPVDSAQYVYESDIANADSAALQARHYDQLAAGQSESSSQLAVTH
jgi:hypothetical protein